LAETSVCRSPIAPDNSGGLVGGIHRHSTTGLVVEQNTRRGQVHARCGDTIETGDITMSARAHALLTVSMGRAVFVGRQVRTLCAFAIAAAVLVSFAASAQTLGKPVRIGFICPFTGGSSDFGLSARLGAELALKEINEVGGYLGRPIELVARDDKANPDEGRRVSEDLVLKEKVDFTVGFCNTGVAMK
jgi:ABC-type branched-subunit amino acid transport system substrate-binding protein